jgi:hypothetical protein
MIGGVVFFARGVRMSAYKAYAASAANNRERGTGDDV